MSDWTFVREQIKERLSLSSVVGRKVRWDARKSQPSRGDMWACCPFHQEKSPSFHVLDREGYFKCFGCGASGDHFTFVMETENCSIAEATERLAQEAGVELPKRDAHAIAAERQRLSVYGLLETAAAFFEAQLKTPEGTGARDYLRERAVPPQLWADFRLGFAPSDGGALVRALTAAGATPQEIREAGLLSSREQPSALLRGRLVFPITDSRGRVIAFGGRVLSGDAQPKYLNTGDSPVFHKGRALYNVAAARARPNRSAMAGPVGADRLVVVEGYMDAIALAAAGFARAVAPLGTALTEDHLKILWQVEDTPVLCFDGDGAGQAAARRAADRALALLRPGKTLSFAVLPGGQDPDDLIRAKGPAAFSAVLAGAIPLAEMLWSAKAEGVDLRDPDGRARVQAALSEACAQIADPVVRRHYEAFVRDRLWALGRTPSPKSPGAIQRHGGGTAPRVFGSGSGSVPARALWTSVTAGGAPAERVFCALLIAHPGLVEDAMETLATVALSDSSLDRLRSEIIDLAGSGPGLDRQGMLDGLAARGLGAEARALMSYGGFTCLPESRPGVAREQVRRALDSVMKVFSVHAEAAAGRAAVAVELSDETWSLRRRLSESSELARREAAEGGETMGPPPAGAAR